MKRTKNNKLVPVLLISALSLANVAFVRSNIWNVGGGTPVDLSSLNAAAYNISGVSQLKDGSYIVTGKAAGFQSEVELAVTFDPAGKIIKTVDILAQAETENIGTKVTDADFLNQFEGALAPLGLTGWEITVISPETGAVWGGAPAQPEEIPAGPRLPNNPDRWAPSRQSAEANAVRNLYRAGLLASAVEKRPLDTCIADMPPEEQAKHRLEQAGLTDGSDDAAVYIRDLSPEGMARKALYDAKLSASSQLLQPMAIPAADHSAEQKAARKLEQAGLTKASMTATSPAAIASTESLYQIDAATSATVTSAAVVTAIDYAYLFMQEKVLLQ